jgi:hypothetical protein
MNADQLSGFAKFSTGHKGKTTLSAKEFLYCSDKCVKIDNREMSNSEKNCLTNCFNLLAGDEFEFNKNI